MRHAFGLVSALVALIVIVPAEPVAVAQAPAQVEVRRPIRQATSRNLRDIPRKPDTGRVREHHVRPVTQPGGPVQQDAAIQQFMVTGLAALPGLGFDGIGEHSLTVPYEVNSVPSDINGAIGLTQYVQWVNTSFAVFAKSDGAPLAGPTAGNTLWEDLGGNCAEQNDGDPIAQFDKIANRWVMTQFQVTVKPYSQCIAVSLTEDATGMWHLYEYTKENFPDYPKLAVWPDAYYITYNMFGGTYRGPKACAYDRAVMLNGGNAAEICFQLSPAIGALLPSDLDGHTLPPGGAPNHLLTLRSTTSLGLYRFDPDFATPANSTLTGPAILPVPAFTQACAGVTRLACIPQPGTSQRLESLSDRLMYRLAYRNFGTHESLVVNHAVSVSGTTGIRWYEIRNPGTTPFVYQASSYQPDTQHRWMGSAAMDQTGNMAMGYSVGSGTLYPGIRFVGREATDPLNNLSLETNIIDGSGSQTSYARWGDYTSMSVDPVDDCTFWYTNQYLKVGGNFNWDTRVASFKFASCTGTTPEPDFALFMQPGSLAVQAGGTASFGVSLSGISGFEGDVSLSAAGLPVGAAQNFTVNPVGISGGSGSSTLEIATSESLAPGTYPFTVTGTSGSTVHSTAASLVVVSPEPADFALSVSPGSRNIRRGDSTTYNVTIAPLDGFGNDVTFELSGYHNTMTFQFVPSTVTGGGSTTLTVATTTSTPKGKYTLAIRATDSTGELTHLQQVSLRVR
jgi:hypothetical protein